MDKLLLKLVESVWGRNFLLLLFVVLVSAICWQQFEIVRVNALMIESLKQAKEEITSTNRRCAEEVDALRREQIATINEYLRRQEEITRRVSALQNRKK